MNEMLLTMLNRIQLTQKQPPRGVLKIYEKFKRKYLCQSVCFSKVAPRGLQLYKKRYSGAGDSAKC